MDPATGQEVPTVAGAGRHHASKRVLAVEDDRDYQCLLKSVLAKPGGLFELAIAETLVEALAAIEQSPPDVILLDLNLPDSSGFSTLRRIRQASRDSCLIVLTGLDLDHSTVQLMEQGAQEYLVKHTTHPRLIAPRIQMALQAGGGRRLTRSASHTPVLGFLGSKGGVGTSTLAENLAALLARESGETTLVRLSPSVERRAPKGDSGNDLDLPADLPASGITAASLQAGPPELVRGLRLLQMKPAPGIWHPPSAGDVTAQISLAQQRSAYVVLDLGSRLDEATAEAVIACDTVTVVLDTEPAAIDAGAELLRQLECVIAGNLPEIRLVMVDRTHQNQQLAASRMAQHPKMRPVVTITPAPDELSNAYQAGVPLLSMLHPDDSFSRSIQALSDVLLAADIRGQAIAP